MKFDRRAPGGGVEVTCRLENGKAFLEWEFHFQKGYDTTGQRTIRLLLMDAQGNMALECVQELCEEERLQSVLLHPQLWDSTQNPYLYTLKAYITDGEGRCLDRLCAALPLRSMEIRGAGELFLNGQPFHPKAVAYSVPTGGAGAEKQRVIFEDLQQLRKLGANCIYAEEKEGLTRLFLRLCDRFGFLVLSGSDEKAKSLQIYGRECEMKVGCQEMPSFRGKSNSLFMPEGRHPTSLYYKYMAKWSKTPFVYIVPESVKKLKSGNYAALCYSSCSRVALYSGGILFELKKGEEEFEFLEIPAKSPCIMLAAEGDGCSAALSVHKTFLRQFQNGALGAETPVKVQYTDLGIARKPVSDIPSTA